MQKFTVPARQRKQLKEATVTVASPKSGKTGQHYDVGFFDDLINDLNFRNPELVKKAIDDFDHYVPLVELFRYVTGTRYVFGDLYEVIIRRNAANSEKTAWIITVKTCWTDDGKEVRFPERVTSDGRVIGFTREKLEQIQRDTPEIFSSQYLNQVIQGRTQLFTEELMNKCVCMPIDPSIRLHKPDEPVLGPTVLFVDLAASKKSRRDHSVIIAGRLSNFNKMYVVDAVGDRWAPHEISNNLILMALKHRPMKIMIEETAAGRYAMRMFQLDAQMKSLFLPMEGIEVSNVAGAKDLRISAVAGPLQKGQLFFYWGLSRWKEIFEQFTQFPNGAHDDYPDTIGLMVQFFDSRIGRNPTMRAMYGTQPAAPPPTGATMKVPGSDGKMHWSDGKRDLGAVQ